MTYESGIPVDHPIAGPALWMLSPPVGMAVQGSGMLDNHNQIIGTEGNDTVLRGVRRRLTEAAG